MLITIQKFHILFKTNFKWVITNWLLLIAEMFSVKITIISSIQTAIAQMIFIKKIHHRSIMMTRKFMLINRYLKRQKKNGKRELLK